MALALYRTYRPGSLAEVIGQEHVTEPLARALGSGRTHHAYLFSGPRGCGKTSTARIIARSLNCEHGPTAQPCGACRSCVELAPNGPGSIDVVELDAATHRGIDDARELREKAIYAPAASRYKIYIIDEAHQLTNEAANALLKLVEEPPAHLRFIFATTEPDKIIPTIRSRTFHYGFRLVPARVLAEHLAGVCAAEGVPAEGPALAAVARAGAGSVRDSLSVLGQLLAGAGPEGLTYADAVSALGLTDATLIDGFVAALGAGSAAQMFGIVDEVISAGHDPRRFVADALERLRDLIVLRADSGALASGLVDVPDDAGERMLEQAESVGMAELSRAADLVSAGLSEVKGATAPRLQLELLCARLALPSLGQDHASVVARLDRIERALAQGGQAATAPAATAPAPSPTAGPGAAAQAPAPPRRPSLRTEAPAPAPAADPPPAPPAPPDTSRPRASTEPAADASRTGAAPTTAPAAPTPPTPPGNGPARPAAPTAARGADAPAASSAPDAAAGAPSGGDLARVQQGWPDVLARLAADSRVAWTAFHAAVPVSLSGGALAVAVSEPGNVRAIAQRGHDERLRQALIDVLGLDVSIDVLHDPAAASPVARPPAGREPRARPPAAPRGTPGSASGSSAGPPSGHTAQSDAAAGAGAARRSGRAGDVVRDAATAPGEPTERVDEPSTDDPDLDASAGDGLALVTRELGARPIGEIDHS